MSHQHDHGSRRGFGARSWFLSVPLGAFVGVSFLSARHLYAEHTSASRHLASLLALMVWTACLSVHVSAGVLRARAEKVKPLP